MNVHTVCGICNGSCSINLSLENGVLVKIEGRPEHPVSQGCLCPKGRAVIELLGAPDRLRHPLKKLPGGQWQEISWEEAIDTIAERLESIKHKYGAEALAVHVGQVGVRKEFTPYIERFCKIFDTPNFSTSGSHCHQSKMMANMLTYGVLPVPDYENSNCIVLWAYNPAKSCLPLMNYIKKARQRGARLIVVDPRATAQARQADFHLQLRPGTDGALALGMINVIIRENLYDKDFVDKWTIGFAGLAEHVKDYPPEKVAQITWIPANKITEAARLYAASSPACLAPGIALELQSNGFQAARAVAVLQAICGNLDIKGGAVFAPPAKLASLAVEKDRGDIKPAVGQNKFPLFHKFTGNAQANIYADAILEGNPYPVKGAIITGSNPVVTWPDADKVKEALGSLEFLVVMDHFLTKTAELADIVLPAATFLDRQEIWDSAPVFGRYRLGLAPKIFNDEGRMTDWQFWNALAKRMGYGEFFPWEDEEEAINFRLQPMGLTIEELKQQTDGYVYGEGVEKKYELAGFKTPSGKVELYSEELKSNGYDPLPTYQEPAESLLSAPETAAAYPLILTTGARTMAYFHSRYHNLPSLRKSEPKPLVEVHPDTAVELDLSEGETVVVESLRGSIELTVKLTDEINPRVIYIPHGWEEANANILTDNEGLDPVTGFPPDRALLARIVKKRR